MALTWNFLLRNALSWTDTIRAPGLEGSVSELKVIQLVYARNFLQLHGLVYWRQESYPDTFHSPMGKQGLPHLLCCRNIVAFLEVNADVALTRSCQPIGRSLATLGVTEIQSRYFDPGWLLHCLARKDSIGAMVTPSIVLTKVGPSILWIFRFQCF